MSDGPIYVAIMLIMSVNIFSLVALFAYILMPTKSERCLPME